MRPTHSPPTHRTLAVCAVAILFLLLPFSAQAVVNHGDYLGTTVDFLQVSETTLSAGDVEPLWEAPALAGAGDQLVFFPSNFTSICSAGSSDVTESELVTTLTAHPGNHIANVMLVENGDATLTQFPPFGTPDTNVTAQVSGTATVLETTAGPIAPVVIPFTGTFAPSSTFALPANFGASTWSGTINVDISSVVPLATEVEFAITNHLSSNCAPGASSAKIQKKEVSGPSVALMVNPIECDVQLEKTCCVPQPVLPDLDICEGEVLSLTMEYTGDKCSKSNNDQGRKAKCYGRRKPGSPADIDVIHRWGPGADVMPDTGVEIGDLVTFSPEASSPFPNRLKIKTTGPHGARQFVKMDTSCNRAINCGDQFGAYKVVGLESTLGGAVDCNAPPAPTTCGSEGDPIGTQCDAKLIDMVLEYNGSACQNPLGNDQNGEASCSGDATGMTDVGVLYTGQHGNRQTVSPSSGINDGDRIRVTATWQGGLFPNQSLRIINGGGVLQDVDFHVSCSQPLALGDQFGSFTLVEFTTKNGTQAALGDGTNGELEACEIPLAPPKPHCTSDLQGVTLVYIGDYLGEGCSVSNDQSGYASCAGDADPGDLVSVAVGSGLGADPEDLIEFGDLVTITNENGGDLPWLTTLDVAGPDGAQHIEFKTSCHKPLSLGDRFGSFVVFGLDREDEGPITLGGNIQYQYSVTNPNDSLLENVSIDDDQLGLIASGLSIPAGETVKIRQTATLFGTTTNVATALGDVAGDFCTPATDQVTVDVVVPADGAFSCSCWQSLSEMTLVWNGAQPVSLVIWDGDAGTGTQIDTVNLMQIGYATTVSGFSEDHVTFEIFDTSGATKLGESRFDVTCRDREMNGIEDCGRNLGNGKADDPTFINDWLLEGMVDDDESMSCTPALVPPPPACGFGPELLIVLPALMWGQRRRLGLA